MRYRKLILGSATLLVIILLFVCFLLPKEARLSLGFVSGQRGHLGDFYSEEFSIMWVTNNTSLSIGLDGQVVQWEHEGRVVSDLATIWGGKDGTTSLPAKSAGSLPFAVPKEAEKFRVLFGYSLSGGRAQIAISRLLGKLPWNRLPQSIGTWLFKNGMLDGRFHRKFEGPWMPNKSTEPPPRWAGGRLLEIPDRSLQPTRALSDGR